MIDTRLARAALLAVGLFDRQSSALAERITNPVAEFTGIDKITGRIITFDVYIDETVQFGALQVTPRVCYSRPETEEPKTDSFVEVDEITLDRKIRRIFTGWMFAESPGLNAVEHAVYDVWLKGCKQKSDVPPPDAAQIRYRAGRDRKARRPPRRPPQPVRGCTGAMRRRRTDRRQTGTIACRDRFQVEHAHCGLIEGGCDDRYRERPARPRKEVLDGRHGILPTTMSTIPAWWRSAPRWPASMSNKDIAATAKDAQPLAEICDIELKGLIEPADDVGDPQLRGPCARATMASPTPRWSAPAMPSATMAGR